MRILSVFLLMMPVYLSAQENEPLRFEHIPGLSQNTVYSIMKDRQGFMWIATADGLNRFDGVQMKIYKPPPEKKEGKMWGRTIRNSILEDDKDRLWFSTELNAISLNKKNNYFTEHLLAKYNSKILGLTVEPLLYKGDSIWFANNSFGVIEFSSKTAEFTVHDVPASGGIPQLIHSSGVYDKKSRLWFPSNKGLFAFDIYKRKWEKYLSGNLFSKITISHDTIYASSEKEILYFNTVNGYSGKISFKDAANQNSQDHIRALYTDRQQNIWAGDEKGNVYCKKNNETVFKWRGNINGTSITQTLYPVYCFYADDEGTLWVGADVLGLLKTKISPNGFKIYPVPEEKKKAFNFFVTSIYEDEQEMVWLGTFQMGLLVLDKKTGKTSTVPLEGISEQVADKNFVGFIKKDSKQNLWVSAGGCLFVKEKGTKQFKRMEIPLPGNSLVTGVLASSITEYKKGWLVGTTLGLYFLSKHEKDYSFFYMPVLGQSKISEIWVDPNENIWMSFESLGVYIARDTANLDSCRILFPETGIKSFFYDESRQLVWISSLSGLIAYHPATGTYKNFNEADGLGNSYVYGAIKNKDELWLSTNRGLSKASTRFNKGSVLPEISFTNYTSNDGLPDDEFNTGAFYQGNSGLLYFGTIKGVVWFEPGEVTPNRYLPEIIITDILVNGQTADSSIAPEYISRLSLPYRKNNLFFSFRGIEYNNPGKVTYAYKLEGWDKDWVFSSTLNEVRYNNLPHGNYVFKVKAANGAGAWNEKTIAISVSIFPPFWRTWWFYSLGAILLLASVIFITRMLTQRKLKKRIMLLEQQRELEKERHRISREMHDDIGAGLTQITLMTESVKSKSAGFASEDFDNITSTSRRLVSNMSEIIWSLNPEQKTLDDLCAYLREQLNKQLEYAGIEYTIQLPQNVSGVILSNEQRRNILQATKEITNNAVKYSQAKNISVIAAMEKNGIVFEIQDNGIGFDTEKKYSGNGLKNIRSRITELGGKLEINSVSGTGSRFWFFVPLKTST
jgi:signal transduction histidine kinase/ligand-binding sensor domain-containing protein